MLAMTTSDTTGNSPGAVAVRPVHPADLPRLYHICLHTADGGQAPATDFHDPDIPGLIYMGPYVAYDPRCAFTLTVDGLPQGYIVGTRTSQGLAEWQHRHWWPTVQARRTEATSPISELEAGMRGLIDEPPAVPAVASRYPAHLHINLLPAAQGGGNGGRLMQAFLEALREQAVFGVHLVLNAKNSRALAFYRKQGFREWDKSAPGSITMVRDL